MLNAWRPDKDNATPLYLQIKNFLRHQIMSGSLPVGARLPTQRELALLFGVNRSTVISALDELIAEDLLESRGKYGTLVKNNGASLGAPPPPNWVSYIRAGNYQPNSSIMQEINRREHDQDMLSLSTPELSPTLYRRELMLTLSHSLPDRPTGLGYECQNGSPALREVLCAYLKKSGVNAAPDQILIVSGALQAIYLIAVGLLYKGSTILTENPSYIYSLNVFQSAGMRLSGVPMDNCGLRLDLLEKLHCQTNASILYTIPNYQNPTGALMPQDRKERLLAYCQRKKLPVIEDDTYRELYFGGTPPLPLKALDKNGLVLLVGSVSKVLFPGLRLGWIVGPKLVIDRLADIKTQVDLGTGSLSQHVMVQLLASGQYDAHLDAIRCQLRQRRDFVLNLLEHRFKGLATWSIPSGGVFIWLNILKPISMSRLFQACLDAGVLLNPGTLYSPQQTNCVRISYSYLDYPQLEKALYLLADILERGLSEP